jgi:hypothetical protein
VGTAAGSTGEAHGVKTSGGGHELTMLMKGGQRRDGCEASLNSGRRGD